MAWAAARQMCSGVVKSGSPRLKSKTRIPSASICLALAPAARVADGFTELLQLKHNGPDESLLIGARSGYPLTGGADWVCARSRHWIFEHTGMADGDRIPGLVGWEWHGNAAPIPGLEVVAEGYIRRWGGRPTYTATVYPGPKGNFVFNGATCWWSDGLGAPPGYQHPSHQRAHPQGPDRRVQRITANLIRRAARA